ncbi:MAG: hypothetical protein PVS2B2_23390 [Candidatus Acidiferrum sp.]
MDLQNATSSLQSDVLLSTLKNVANHPFKREDMDRRRQLRTGLSARIIPGGQNLDVYTLPVIDSHGLTRLDYAIRLLHPSDLVLNAEANGRFSYSIDVRVLVFGPENQLLFTQQRELSDSVSRQRLAEIKDRVFGYEGSLPLPPGKYRLDFLITDRSQKIGFHADHELVIPGIDSQAFVIGGILPFDSTETVEPSQTDSVPFEMAGIKFVPLLASSAIHGTTGIQIAYQIWGPPRDPREYTGQKLEVNYALGQISGVSHPEVIKEEIDLGQFNRNGWLVSGKKFGLEADSSGNYLLTVSLNQKEPVLHGSARLNFRVLPDNSFPLAWDVIDRSIGTDARMGILDQQRGLCLLASGQPDQARKWLRRALDLDHKNDPSRARLVDAYYEKKDYSAVVSLFNDARITDDTDSKTILRIAESLQIISGAQTAISMLEEALQSRSEDGPLYIALSNYYERIGDTKKAAELERKGKSFMEHPVKN